MVLIFPKPLTPILCEDHVATLVRSSVYIDGGAFPSFEACMYVRLFRKKIYICILTLQFVLIMVGSSIDVLCTSTSPELLDFFFF